MDAPVPARVLLEINTGDNNYQEVIDRFKWLYNFLYQSNLIFQSPRIFRRQNTGIELSVVFQDRKSFENWDKSTSIIKDFTKYFIDERFLITTVEDIDLELENDNVYNCECEESEFYFLQGRTFQFIDELICGTCRGRVPYSVIPLEIEIEKWQKHYERTFLNWLDSDIFEKQALRQLIKADSILNIRGEKIRSELQAYFKKTVYICYYEIPGRTIKLCPKCKQKGTEIDFKNMKYKCEDCKTMFGYQ